MTTADEGAVPPEIEQLRRRIEDGTYRPPVEAVADAILRVWSGAELADAWTAGNRQEACEDATSSRSSL
jgi:Anti-sigma-28 factor, FlgM